LREKIEKLSQETLKKDFWRDTLRAQKISEELAELKETIKVFGKIESDLKDLDELAEIGNVDKELDREINKKLNDIEKRLSAEEIKIFLSGENDKDNALMSIHAGAGGVDAQDWSEMLLSMYMKYFANNGYKAKIIDVSYGEEAGIKSVDIEVRGRYAYGYLKEEAGVHRLVRLSPFNAQHLRHTSFAKVEVLPISENVGDIKINPEEIEIDTYRSSGPGGQHLNKTDSAVRIHHIPTGIIAASQSERSQAQNKENALKILKLKLKIEKAEKEEHKKSELRKSAGKAEWAHQIRSYVLHPYKMVKDHRTNVEEKNVEKILKDGELDIFVEAALKLSTGN
jgi:peptide chain release factor 2